MKPHDWLRFAHIEPFPGQWDRLGLSDESLRALEICIMTDPRAGAVVPGTGGLRKLRFTTPGSAKGKSGAYRVFYVYFPEYGIVTLMAIIAKGQSANLNKADRNALGKIIDQIRRLLEGGTIR